MQSAQHERGYDDGREGPDDGRVGRVAGPDGRDGRGDRPSRDRPALSWVGRTIVGTAVVGVAAAVAVHLSMVFLHVAPENTLSKEHGSVIDDYIYPEFEQNWKLFAPNPLQQNIAVHARAEVVGDDGRTTTTDWVNLSAQDGARIHHNLLPSHTAQNELRRAWDFYVGSHDSEERPLGPRGELSKAYVKRIVMDRLGLRMNGGVVDRIQIRSATTRVAPPEWSEENYSTETEYRVLPWWDVSTADLSGGADQ